MPIPCIHFRELGDTRKILFEGVSHCTITGLLAMTVPCIHVGELGGTSNILFEGVSHCIICNRPASDDCLVHPFLRVRRHEQNTFEGVSHCTITGLLAMITSCIHLREFGDTSVRLVPILCGYGTY